MNVTSRFERDGFTVTVGWDDDEYCDKPSDNDEGITPAQEAAWFAGDWQYVVLFATVEREGVVLHRASLGCVEAGDYVLTTEDDVVTGRQRLEPWSDHEYMDDLVAEAIGEARNTIAKLCASVA